ncbi:phage capsid protein [Escherichia coli]|nr:phage capsid protein [Escherichia coli]
MSKKKGKTPQPAAKKMTASAPKMEAFTFGEPVPVLDRRDILDYVECISNGRWYEPPVSFTGLAKSLRAAVHHSSPIYVKRNILASTFILRIPLYSITDLHRSPISDSHTFDQPGT